MTDRLDDELHQVVTLSDQHGDKQVALWRGRGERGEGGEGGGGRGGRGERGEGREYGYINLLYKNYEYRA